MLRHGLALCSWDLAHREPRLTFTFSGVTVVVSLNGEEVITVITDYPFDDFAPRLRSTGPREAKRPFCSTLYRRSRHGTLRVRVPP